MAMKKCMSIFSVIVAMLLILGSGTMSYAAIGENHGTSNTAARSLSGKKSSEAVSESDILSVLFHLPYLDAAGIGVNYKSDRAKMPGKIASALKESPVSVRLKDGGLFGSDYYAVTSGGGEYYYYGKVKDNKPDGFGVLTRGKVLLDDLSTIGNLIYAGNFKKGMYNDYGALFNSPTRDFSTYVSGFIQNGWLDRSYDALANAYMKSYVAYDGGWAKGVQSGKGNFFQLGDYLALNTVVQEGYWGGTCYPKITVTDVKKGLAQGNTKQYTCGVLVFDGKTKKGLPNGKGTSYFLNGGKEYTGQWKDGKYHGKGKLYDETGKLIYNGKWKNGDYES